MLRAAVVYLSVFGFAFYLSAGPCFSQTAASLDDAKANIVSLIEAGDMAGADAALEGLLGLADSEAKGRVIHEVAGVYKKL